MYRFVPVCHVLESAPRAWDGASHIWSFSRAWSLYFGAFPRQKGCPLQFPGVVLASWVVGSVEQVEGSVALVVSVRVTSSVRSLTLWAERVPLSLKTPKARWRV